MKQVFYILTIFLQLILIVYLQLLVNFTAVVFLIAACLIGGLIVSRSDSDDSVKEIAQGVLWGSVTSLVLFIGFVVWIVTNLPG